MRQGIMDLIYLNLYTTGIGAKYFTANATVAGTLITESNTEIGLYDLSVSGTTTVRNGSTLSKSGSGNLLFVGLVTVTNTVNTFIDFSVGNPSVELRGGITCATNQASSNVKTGTGTWTFTTNNQSITPGNSASITFMGNVIISGNITVTAVNGLGVNGVFTQFNGSVNGTTSLSTLKNAGAIYLGAASPVVMTTGIFDYYYTGTTVGYVMNASYSIPLTSFYALVIGGTGTKTLTGNTTLSTNLTLLASAILDCSTFDLNIAGTSTISSGGKLSKTGAGNILFTGLLSMTNGNIDFSGGNPTVEFRGGISGGGTMSVSTGTGQWKFSTNNQVIINYPTSYNSPILISGAITVTVSSVAISTINNTLNGDNAASIFDNRGNINYTNATAPMVTGKLYCNQAANKWSYYAAGNQDIRVPSDPIPGYYNLSLDTSGAKKLLGNVSVKGTYATSGTATLDSNGFSLTNP
ncbi:MAG: hypothetical protein ABI091_03560, partial [Ferruginibacter sp.]